MQAPAPAPTAQGSFAKTPFPHLLVYALERGLNGSFELHVGGQSVATLLVVGGAPAKVRTTEGVHYLGDVLVELGLVTAEALRASHERMSESPRLQGQILLEMGVITEAQLEAGVRAQLERKLDHLFTLPGEAIFSYYDQIDTLQRYGGAATPIDPFPVLWRGIRQAPAWEHVDATLRRVGSTSVRLTPTSQVDRFQFTRGEAGALDLLRQRPMRVVDLANAKIIGPSVAQLLVYLLMITKQVDLVETATPADAAAGVPPDAPSTGRLPGSSPNLQPPTGQTVARVQLQAKSIQRSPLIVEEAPVPRSATDGRIASPLPQALVSDDARANVLGTPQIPASPPAPEIVGVPPAPSLDIGAMISTAIHSSMPPPLASATASPPPAPPAPSTPASAPPADAPSAPAEPVALTAEQTSLKQKIVERAAAISGQDYFQMLGVERDATTEAVQKAFFGLAKVWHPDRLPPALVDVKDACSKVFTHLTEAQATLTDPERRAEYMTLLKDGGATPDDQAKIQAVLEAATEFQKAEFFLKRNDLAQAHELAKKAHALDPEQADYLAMATWIDSQKPEFSGREKTLEMIGLLERCIKMNAHCERAYFWRGMLYKRIDEQNKAIKDFKKACELNPRNLDAMREVRLHNMRGGQSKPPPGAGHSSRPSGKPPAAPEKLGGLFGKLFKK